MSSGSPIGMTEITWRRARPLRRRSGLARFDALIIAGKAFVFRVVAHTGFEPDILPEERDTVDPRAKPQPPFGRIDDLLKLMLMCRSTSLRRAETGGAAAEGAALPGSHRLEFRLVEDDETQALHFDQARPLE